VGKLPTIIGEYSDPNSFTNSYIYADAQILVQYAHSGDPNAADDKYYYVHDRLGSVRLVIGYDGNDAYVENHYTYSPFGETLESSENTYNPFQFTGQWLDSEIEQYYLRARMYDPKMMRFTTRDSVKGRFENPTSLHKYLYCVNDPINHVDLNGRSPNAYAAIVTQSIIDGTAVYSEGMMLAAYSVETNNDKFWELSRIMFKFMPVAMVLGALEGGTGGGAGKIVTDFLKKQIPHNWALKTPEDAVSDFVYDSLLDFMLPYKYSGITDDAISGLSDFGVRVIFNGGSMGLGVSEAERNDFFNWK
jgi:RHS repeat-associated protein